MSDRNYAKLDPMLYSCGFPCQPPLSSKGVSRNVGSMQVDNFCVLTHNRLVQGTAGCEGTASCWKRSPPNQSGPPWKLSQGGVRKGNNVDPNFLCLRTQPLIALLENVYGVLTVKEEASPRVTY